MNKTDKEIKDEVLKRAAALDENAVRRRKSIPGIVCGIIILFIPFSAALRPASAPDPNEYSTEFYNEPSTVLYTVPELKETFIYHAASKQPITQITVKGVTYYVNTDITVTDENMGEFIEEINVESVTCAVYRYKNDINTVILSTGMEEIAFTKE